MTFLARLKTLVQERECNIRRGRKGLIRLFQEPDLSFKIRFTLSVVEIKQEIGIESLEP